MKTMRKLATLTAACSLFACSDAGGLPVDFGDPAQSTGSLEEALQETPNPGARGPHAVTSVTYGADSQRYQVNGVLSEHLGQIHYPSDMHNGPYPLVLMIHGDHPTCEAPSGGSGSKEWPCQSPDKPVPSYLGHDYLAEVLASHGMIVSSISANGMNAVPNNQNAPRGKLLSFHMNQFDHYNAFGEEAFNPFPGVDTFKGMIDMDRVGLVGHSKGGAAVIDVTQDIDRLAGNVRAVVAIAPTTARTLNHIPLAVVKGYCDGDVASRMPGFNGFDGARYADASDEAEKYTFLVPGANHNFFNRIWSPGTYASPPTHARDDADTNRFNGDSHCDASVSRNGRLSEAEQQVVAKVYVSAFLRRHLQGETEFDVVLRSDVVPAPRAVTRDVQVGFHAGASERLDINTLVDAGLFEDEENELGGEVELEDFSIAELCNGSSCIDRALRGPRRAHLHQRLQLAWDEPGAKFTNKIPSEFDDVRDYEALQFRVSTDHTDERNPSSRDFRVVLRDRSGDSSSVRAASFSNALDFPPGDDDTRMSLMSTVRIPLSEFDDVNLKRIKSVELVFDESETGDLLFSDFAFSK